MTTTARRQRRSWGKIRRLTHGSGRLQASYMHDLARHTAPATFTSKMDAEHWLADERRLIERGEWTPPAFRAAQTHAKAQTLIDYADTWLEHRNLKPRTRALYRDLLDGPLAPLHRVPLGLISAESVRAWHSGLGTATPRKREHAYQLLHAISPHGGTTKYADGCRCDACKAAHTERARRDRMKNPNARGTVITALPTSQASQASKVWGDNEIAWTKQCELSVAARKKSIHRGPRPHSFNAFRRSRLSGHLACDLAATGQVAPRTGRPTA